MRNTSNYFLETGTLVGKKIHDCSGGCPASRSACCQQNKPLYLLVPMLSPSTAAGFTFFTCTSPKQLTKSIFLCSMDPTSLEKQSPSPQQSPAICLPGLFVCFLLCSSGCRCMSHMYAFTFGSPPSPQLSPRGRRVHTLTCHLESHLSRLCILHPLTTDKNLSCIKPEVRPFGTTFYYLYKNNVISHTVLRHQLECNLEPNWKVAEVQEDDTSLGFEQTWKWWTYWFPHLSVQVKKTLIQLIVISLCTHVFFSMHFPVYL